MGINTDIEWADSTLNLQMGCDGCELWNPKAGVRRCYAGIFTDHYAGQNKGFPASFDQPKLFLHRLDAALGWSDLTGRPRRGKPWLDGRPRTIFLNDMGDTFTESLPLDWLAPLLPRLAASPHIYMLLTKRAKRMREFSESHPLPINVWPGVSVTGENTLPRVGELLGVRGGGVRWVSAEPLWEEIRLQRWLGNRADMVPWQGVELVITGGESRGAQEPLSSDLAWFRLLSRDCLAAGVAFFLKQMGARPVCNEYVAAASKRFEEQWGFPPSLPNQIEECRFKLRDPKGGDMDEWPEDLRIRQFPLVGNSAGRGV